MTTTAKVYMLNAKGSAKAKAAPKRAPVTRTAGLSLEQRFVRLADIRVNNLLNSMRVLGNLMSHNWRSSPEQREKILEACAAGFSELEYKFQEKNGSVRRKPFKL